MVALLCAWVTVAAATAPYPSVDVTMCDNPYCIGYRTGAEMASTINRRLRADKELPLLRAFFATPQGKAVVEEMALYNCESYPRVHSELAGLVDGSGAAYEDLLLLSLRPELSLYLRNASVASSWWRPLSDGDVPARIEGYGTDYVMRDAGGAGAIAHNEDSSPGSADYAYWITARVNAQPTNASSAPAAAAAAAPPATWSAFTYAGELPGSAFAASGAGFGFSANAVFPQHIRVAGYARAFVLRGMLDSADAEAAWHAVVAAAPNMSAGVSLSIVEAAAAAAAAHGGAGNNRSSRAWAVEAGGGAAADVLALEPAAAYFHANEFRRLPAARMPQWPDPSSAHRLGTYMAGGYARDAIAIATGVRLLGDASDKAFPVFRTGASPQDGGALTLATAVFDGANGSLTVMRGNPQLGGVTHRFSFRRVAGLSLE